MNLPQTHELVRWDGRSWALTEPQYRHLNERLEAGAKFLVAPDADQSKVALGDVKFLGKRNMSLGDIIQDKKALPEGEKQFNPLGAGYIKFIANSIRLKHKQGTSVTSVTSKLSDEQKVLVNAELKKKGVNFQV